MPSIKIESDDHWHELRNSHIGGSDIASLFYEVEYPPEPGRADGQIVVQSITDPILPGGRPMACLSPYKTGYRLWLEKAGRLKPEFVENERIDAGHFLEAALAGWAMKKWPDIPMRKVRRYITHPQISGWGATLDYETVTGLRPVEFKNVDFLVFRDQWGQIETPPLHIMLQLQAQLGVTAKAEGDIIACVGGNELMRATFPLHEATQIKIAKAIAEFWTSVAVGKPPRAFADIDTASDYYRFGNTERAVGVELVDPVFDDLCKEIVEIKARMASDDMRKKNLEGRIAMAMGNLSAGAATRALTSRYQITWPVVVRPAQMYPARWSDEITYRQGLRIKEIT